MCATRANLKRSDLDPESLSSLVACTRLRTRNGFTNWYAHALQRRFGIENLGPAADRVLSSTLQRRPPAVLAE